MEFGVKQVCFIALLFLATGKSILILRC